MNIPSTLKVPKHLTPVVALLAMVGPLTIDTYLPAFPGIQASFHIEKELLSHSLGAYLVSFAFFMLFWGSLADSIGRRLVIILSLCLYLIASIACALSTDYETFLLFRAMQGFAASGTLVAGRAMIRDSYSSSRAHKAMSQVTLLFGIAPAIAPLLGGVLYQYFGWQSIFGFLAVFASLILFLMGFIKETLPCEHKQAYRPKHIIKIYINTLSHPQFLQLVLIISCSFSGFFIYIAGAPTIIYDFLGLGAEDFPVLFIPLVSGMMLGAFISTKLALQWPIQRTIGFGFILMSFSALLNLVQAAYMDVTPITIIAPVALYALGVSLVLPAITVLSLDCFPNNRGSAAAMQGFIQMLMTAAIASLVIPFLHEERLYFVLSQLLLLLLARGLWSRITKYSKY